MASRECRFPNQGYVFLSAKRIDVLAYLWFAGELSFLGVSPGCNPPMVPRTICRGGCRIVIGKVFFKLEFARWWEKEPETSSEGRSV